MSARDELLHALSTVLDDNRIAVAVLFGSAARDRLRDDSDLDVGILPRDDLTLAEELQIQGRLARATGRDIDLVRLDHADTMLKWRIARHGIVLRSVPEHEAARFRARAALEHADFAPAFEDARRRYRRHLVEER